MADWTKPFEAAYVWRRVPRTSYAYSGDAYFDKIGTETETLDSIIGGTIETNADTETFTTASIECAEVPNVGTDLVRCHLLAAFEDGTTEDVVLGTWLPSIPSRDIDSPNASCTVRLDGRLMELQQDTFAPPVIVNAGVDAPSYVQVIVARAHITVSWPFPAAWKPLGTKWVLGLSSSDEDGDESKLAAINRLLDYAGYRSAQTDEYGRVLVQLPVDYASEPVWTFREGASATFLGQATDERDSTDICNVAVAVFESQDSTVIGRAEDHSSEWSIENLGREKVAVYKFNDSATQAQANTKAAELLDRQLSVIRRVTIRHVWCGARTGDVVALEWPSMGISGNFAIRRQTIAVGSAGCLCTSELRRFERG